MWRSLPSRLAFKSHSKPSAFNTDKQDEAIYSAYTQIAYRKQQELAMPFDNSATNLCIRAFLFAGPHSTIDACRRPASFYTSSDLSRGREALEQVNAAFHSQFWTSAPSRSVSLVYIVCMYMS